MNHCKVVHDRPEKIFMPETAENLSTFLDKAGYMIVRKDKPDPNQKVEQQRQVASLPTAEKKFRVYEFPVPNREAVEVENLLRGAGLAANKEVVQNALTVFLWTLWEAQTTGEVAKGATA